MGHATGAHGSGPGSGSRPEAGPEAGTASEPPPSPGEITEILATGDLPLRNLRITHAYHRIATALAGLLGDRDANWFVFGTWASRTAGQYIRGEPRFGLLPQFPGPVPLHLQRFLLAWAAPQVSTNLAEGNRLVFEELAPLFHTLLTAYAEEQDPERALARVLATLTPGPLAAGGQDLLIAAVRSYHQVMSLPHGPARAQRMLLANLQVSLHEQTRLQEAIAGSLVPPLRLPFTPAPVRALARHIWRRLATGQLMDLQLPAPDFTTSRTLVPLRLGRDVGRPHGRTGFPEELTELTDIELKATLYDLDRTPDSILGSAACDWERLAERMNYLVDLFRIWQQDRGLLQAPFTPEQAAAIRAGTIPGGPPL